MLAALIAWLAAHQAIAATITVYLGLTAAGVDVVKKTVELEREFSAKPAIEAPAKPQGAEPME